MKQSLLRCLTRLVKTSAFTPSNPSLKIVTCVSTNACFPEKRKFSTSTWARQDLITGVFHDASTRLVNVEMKDGRREMYPIVWLRDSCLCSECHDWSSQSRSLVFGDLDTKAGLTSITASDDGKTLKCEWTDGHQSEFSVDWLTTKSFDPKEQLSRLNEFNPPQEAWDEDYIVPYFNYDKIMDDDQVLLEFLHKLWVSGLTIVEGSPPHTALSELSTRTVNSRMHETNYGLTFDVVTLNNPNNVAYTDRRLGLHSDLPYYKYSPNIQILHCIKQCGGEGGGNEFADGIYAAQLLKQKDPNAFNLLATVDVDHYDIGRSEYDFHLHYRRPLIDLDRDGTIVQTFFNQQVRDYTLNIPLMLVQPWYDAVAEFNRLMYQNLVRVRLRGGDMAIFNNCRVLHGRQQITDVSGEGRHLMGGYWSWDEIKSTMRVTKAKLENKWMSWC